MITRKDVLDFATSCGVKSIDLDETVHDCASKYASRVNNSGVPEQISFLIDNIGSEETMVLLQEIEKENNWSAS